MLSRTYHLEARGRQRRRLTPDT